MYAYGLRSEKKLDEWEAFWFEFGELITGCEIGKFVCHIYFIINILHERASWDLKH